MTCVMCISISFGIFSEFGNLSDPKNWQIFNHHGSTDARDTSKYTEIENKKLESRDRIELYLQIPVSTQNKSAKFGMKTIWVSF